MRQDWWRRHIDLSAHRGHRTASCKICDWHGTVNTPNAFERLAELVVIHLYERHQILPPMKPKG